MNAVEIEEAVSKLAEAAFDAAEFPFAFLEAFGNKPATIKQLRSGHSNKSDVESGVLQRNHIHLAVCESGRISSMLSELRDSPANAKGKVKFILATDGVDLEADTQTLYRLGMMYQAGQGTPSDWKCDSGKLLRSEKCFKWWDYFSDAARNGHTKSQIHVANYILYFGPLTLGWAEPDEERCKLANQYLIEASKKGAEGAYLSLGMHGCGLDDDDRFNFIRKSANLGNTEAFIPLAERYRLGRGTKVDMKNAFVWCSIAHATGKYKDLRGDAGELSENVKSEAVRLAQDCVRKKYKGC